MDMIFLILIYLAFISLGLPDSLLGSSWPIMNTDLGVPIENAGIASSIISIGTIISSLLSYKLIRIIGTGKVTIISVAMTAAALLGFSLSPSFIWLLACAIPLGLGGGAVDAGLNRFVAEHYEAKHMNWLHGFWGVGAMLGPILMSTLVLWGNTWRSGYFTISMVQFSLVILLLFSLPMWRKFEGPSTKPTEEDLQSKDKPGLLASLKTRGAIFGMFSFFLVSSTEASMMLWGSSYLVKNESISPESAAGWVSLFFLGITAGRMLSGFISIKLSNEALIRLGAILMIFGFFIMLLPLPTIFTLISFIIVGTGLAPIYPSMLHQTPIYFGQHNAQAAMGMQMAFAYTGTTLVAPLFGQLFAHVSFSLMPYVLLTCGVGLLTCREMLTRAYKKKAGVHKSASLES
ncbi:MFS transporter [Paenibacillus sp. FSL H7-0331]|nr:MFS transporter [Paenibacillus sp. FSL H7-0331]